MSSKLIRPLISAGLVGAELAYNYFTGPSNTTSYPSTSTKSVYKSMAYARRSSYSRPRRSAKRIFKRTMRYVPRPMSDNRIVSFKRTTDPVAGTLTAGLGSEKLSVLLNTIYTSDIIASYEAYRIKKVTLCLAPRFYLGNGAATNAANSTLLHVYSACDQTNGQGLTSTGSVLHQFANSKYKCLNGGDNFYYTFYPKAVNVVANGGATAVVGQYGKYNPWLNLDPTGITIPHYNCLLALETTLNTNINGYTYTFTIEFDCMRSR